VIALVIKHVRREARFRRFAIGSGDATWIGAPWRSCCNGPVPTSRSSVTSAPPTAVVFAPVADFSTVEPKSRDAAVRDAVERYAVLLDRYCRCDPYNWFNFFDFWREPNRKP